MKLIDILVSSGDGMSLFGLRTKYLAMDPDGRVYGYTEMPTPGIIGWSVPDNLYSTDGRGCLIKIDRDDVDGQWQSAIITREQYEAALSAKNEGWIEWGGGLIPVDVRSIVDVKFNNGNIHTNQLAGGYSWEHEWADSNIIAYRLHQPKEAEQAKADNEADLNECISQDAAPVWNGEGVTPQAGCMCELSWAGDEWQPCKILFISNQLVVSLKESGIEEAYSISDVIFRPICSEAERKRDESLRVIYEILDAGTSTKQDAADIYDAIAAGKIPGVKLED